MASKGKAKSYGASSFLDLKAEISKKEEEFAKSKVAGNQFVLGGVKRPDKKPTVWQRQNKGVNSRATRDVELEAISKPTLESARSALERKAKIYEKLKKGKTGGLSDKQYEALLVDFDSKPGTHNYESDSDDVGESLTLPKRHNDEHDPIVEYEDEFGRIRTARRSEVPRNLLPAEDEIDEDEDIIIRDPTNYFPTYELSDERRAQVEAEFAEENNPLNIHYDASREVRAKGAGFYQFSGDEETRRKQMEELKAAREETGKMREELGAVDVRPGEVEGMRVEKQGKSKAMEKRKREMEERRKLIEAKRRKVTGQDGPTPEPATKSKSPEQEGPSPQRVQADSPAPAPVDPMAALEAISLTGARGSHKALDADSFLAELEKDFLSKNRKKR